MVWDNNCISQEKRRSCNSSDGQVTLGDAVMKSNAKKVRSLASGKVITGFAGATADAFTLFERLEAKLEKILKQFDEIMRRNGKRLENRQILKKA